jgi:hypothetical protein
MGLAWDIMFWSVCINVAIGMCGFMINNGELFGGKPGYKNVSDTGLTYTLSGNVANLNASEAGPLSVLIGSGGFVLSAISMFFTFIAGIIWVYPTLVTLFGIPMWIAGGLETLLAIVVIWNLISWYTNKDYRY